MNDIVKNEEDKLKKQFQFSIIIESDDIVEAKQKAIEIFGLKFFEEQVFWQQVFIKVKDEPDNFELNDR